MHAITVQHKTTFDKGVFLATNNNCSLPAGNMIALTKIFWLYGYVDSQK